MTSTIKRLSASKLDLAASCLWWAREDVELPPDVMSPAAEFGKAFHELAAAVIMGGPLPATDDRVGKMVAAWAVCWPAYAPANARAELWCLYDLRTGAVRIKGERDRKRPTEISCIIDVLGDGDGFPRVIDHKTGQQRVEARKSRQLILAALCAAKLARTPPPRVQAEFHYVGEDGSIETDVAIFDSLDLDALEGELAIFAEEEDPKPAPGEHCTNLFCAALSVCPAVRGEMNGLVPLGDLVTNMRRPADVQRWLEVAPRVKKLLEQLDIRAKELCDASGGELQLPDGRRYVKTVSEFHVFDAKAAKETLGELAEGFNKVQRRTEYRVKGSANG